MDKVDLFQQDFFLKLAPVYKNQIRESYRHMRDLGEMKVLEEEWAKYKYLVLEHSQKKYLQIRELLKDKQAFPLQEFLSLVCQGLCEDGENRSKLNSIDHVWGYFKKIADEEEKERYKEMVSSFLDKELPIKEIKIFLYSLSEKYQVEFLLKSYYFIEIRA